MRMARVNITMPDDLYAQARQVGLNVSQLAQRAVGDELNRLAKIAELDAYLIELEEQLGPTTATERAEAKTWADKALGAGARRHSA
jgi:post-segregation antitoxin (ccd killing protein)